MGGKMTLLRGALSAGVLVSLLFLPLVVGAGAGSAGGQQRVRVLTLNTGLLGLNPKLRRDTPARAAVLPHLIDQLRPDVILLQVKFSIICSLTRTQRPAVFLPACDR